MTTRPSDRALAIAFFEVSQDTSEYIMRHEFCEYVIDRAREIDAKPVEGLLPCPFCGGEAAIFYNTDANVGCTDVQCKKCLNGTGHWRTETVAIARWNRREGRG